LARCLFKLCFGVVIAAGLVLYLWFGGHGSSTPSARSSIAHTTANRAATSAAQSWGNIASLPDHFARHGSEFGARSPEEYARMASQFLQRAKTEGLPAKVDRDGVLRIFDAATDTFGAYNSDGTTKTFFKPGSRGYFERQPGQTVNLRTWRQK
jgi:pyocin large subunit-like protein